MFRFDASIHALITSLCKTASKRARLEFKICQIFLQRSFIGIGTLMTINKGSCEDEYNKKTSAGCDVTGWWQREVCSLVECPSPVLPDPMQLCIPERGQFKNFRKMVLRVKCFQDLVCFLFFLNEK